jgi:hypothetical protein
MVSQPLAAFDRAQIPDQAVLVIGLLPPDQIDLAGYALTAYKNASSSSQGSDAKPSSHAPMDHVF